MIYYYQKKLGESMTELLERFKLEYNLVNTKLCFTGRLDPIAFGSIYILSDNDVQLKNKYCNLNKVYEFSMIHGITTDTFDIMGLITNSSAPFNLDILTTNYPYSYEQEYPPYSSQMALCEFEKDGITHKKKVPLWLASLNNYTVLSNPTKNITLFNAENLETINLDKDDLFNIVQDRIFSVVKQTFRQKEILEKWYDVLEDDITYTISKHRIKISSGGYVRCIANSCNSCAFDIHRIGFD
jgi:hypothetical protein